MTERYQVRYDQTYAYNDPRRAGRMFTVEFLTVTNDHKPAAICRQLDTGKTVCIALSRFKNVRSGYSLVRDV